MNASPDLDQRAALPGWARFVIVALGDARRYGSCLRPQGDRLHPAEVELLAGLACRVRGRFGERGGDSGQIDLVALGTEMIVRAAADLGGEPVRSDLLTVSEVAHVCGVDETTAGKWVASGRLRVVRTVDGRDRVPVEEVERMLAADSQARARALRAALDQAEAAR